MATGAAPIPVGKEVMEDLATTFLALERTLTLFPNHKARHTLATWLQHVTEAYYETCQIFHEINYRQWPFVEQRKKKHQSSKPIIIKPLAELIKKASQKKKENKEKLLDRLNQLKQVAAQAKTFCHLLGIHTRNSTTSSVIYSA